MFELRRLSSTRWKYIESVRAACRTMVGSGSARHVAPTIHTYYEMPTIRAQPEMSESIDIFFVPFAITLTT